MCDPAPAAPAPASAPAAASKAADGDAQPPSPAAPKADAEAESAKQPADGAMTPAAQAAAAVAKAQEQATPEAAPVNGPASPRGAEKPARAPSKAAATSTGASPKTPPTDAASGDAAPGTPPAMANFRTQFRAFSRFGDPKSDGRHLTLSQSDKWLKQARVVDGRKVTTTDTGIYFKKLKLPKLGMEDYKKFLEDLAKNKKLDIEEVKTKMASCGAPGLSSAAGAAKSASTIERLTDTSRYTGAHKQRFDESGRGKGISGRKDIPDASGYVQGYQNRDTYDKTH